LLPVKPPLKLYYITSVSRKAGIKSVRLKPIIVKALTLPQTRKRKMNVLIIKTSECRLFAEEIVSNKPQGLSKTMEISTAYSACCDCLETGEAVESITIIFNGEVSEYTINDVIQEFFKTI